MRVAALSLGLARPQLPEFLTRKEPVRFPTWVVVAVAAVPLLVGLLGFPFAITGLDLAHVSGDMLDGRFNNWVLEHGYQYLIGRAPSFWSPPVFYPTASTLALSDSHIGTLPIYGALRLTGIDRETAYQLWLVGLCVLNYAVCFLVLRGFGATPLGAAAGAFVFAFGLPIRCFFCHLQIIPRMGVPLFCYWGWRFLKTGRSSYWLGTGLAGLWQLAATIYIAWFLILSATVFLIVISLQNRRQVWEAVIRAPRAQQLRRLVILMLCIGLAYLLMRVYLKASPPDVLERNRPAIAAMLPHLRDWISAPPEANYWGWLFQPKGECRGHLFLGGACLLAIFSLMWKGMTPLRQLGIAAAASLLVCVLITTEFGSFSLYWYFVKLPGVAAVRCIIRIVAVALFPAALLVAIFLTRCETGLASRISGAFALLIAGLLAVGSVVEHRMRLNSNYGTPKAELHARVDALAHRIALADPEARSAVLLTKMNNSMEFWSMQVEMMLAAQQLGIATLNGYSGHFPEGYPFLQNGSDLEAWKTSAQSGSGPFAPRKNRYFQRDGYDHLVILNDVEGTTPR